MNEVLHRGHTIRTDWHPISELGNWPLDHVFVSTEQGHSWGCFGRGLAEDPNARVVCQGYAIVEWATEIAGTDGSAGVQHCVTGVCHCCANRILIPAGVDVHDASGNEIVVPIFGKYGLGLPALIDRVKAAASAVNGRTPNSISDSALEQAIQRVTRAKEDEYEILMDDIDDFLHVKFSSLPADARASMKTIYSELYDKRQAEYEQFAAGRITADEFKMRMRTNVTAALHEVRDLLGQEAFHAVFRMPPELAAAYLFAREGQ